MTVISEIILEIPNIASLGFLSIYIGHSLFCGFNTRIWLHNSLLRKQFQLVSIVNAPNPDTAHMKLRNEYVGSPQKTKNHSS